MTTDERALEAILNDVPLGSRAPVKLRRGAASLVAALALAALVLVGCASGGDDTSSSSDTTTSTGDSSTTGAPTTTKTPTTTEAPTTSDADSAGSTVHTVVIKGFKFSPAGLQAKVGDTITFRNEDRATHTGTTEAGAPTTFDTGDIAAGQSVDVTVEQAGTYDYQCDIHNYMKGQIEVAG